MQPKKTHRNVKKPEITFRYLADYMAGTDRARRRIVKNCRYPALARLMQHKEARLAISKYYRQGGDIEDLVSTADKLYAMMADDDFRRDELDSNADYIMRFVKKHEGIKLPKADILDVGPTAKISIGGVLLKPDVSFRTLRVTKTNKVRVGGASVRYSKNKPLPEETGLWQSAIMLGYLRATNNDAEQEPEPKICLTIDAWSGVSHFGPTDSTSRFQNAEAACETIAQQWSQIAEPPNAAF